MTECQNGFTEALVLYTCGMSEGFGYKRIESRESPELFRATIGFDFVFTESEDGKKPYCVEINGERSGIRGIMDIPKENSTYLERLFADIRMRENTEYGRKQELWGEFMEEAGAGFFPMGEEMDKAVDRMAAKSLSKDPMFDNAVRNPEFIEVIASNKRMQQRVIPEEYRPRVYKLGEPTESQSDAWLLKPVRGIGGRDISIITDKMLEGLKELDPKEQKSVMEHLVIQEFIEPLGADMAAPGQKHNPACLRLIMDFKYLEDGTIEPSYEAAYQRVSPHTAHELLEGEVSESDVYVVNKATGAASAAASADEKRMAHEAAEAIIHKLAESYREHLDSEAVRRAA